MILPLLFLQISFYSNLLLFMHDKVANFLTKGDAKLYSLDLEDKC